jgi:RNA polymerase sigma-70 factor (ECF subfamily)
VDRPSSSDAALVGAIRRGDEEAFTRLYAAYQGPIFRYALHMCGAGAADDVVQETFLALLRGGRFDADRGTLAGYLFGIARHHILKRLAVTRLEAAEDDDRIIEATAPDEPSPFDDLSRAEAVAAVRAAIQSLPPVYREIITLCELEELDYAAAARIVECPVGTVRSRLHRAKALLSAKLVRLKADATYDLANRSSHPYVGSGFSRTSGVRRS